MDANLYSVLKRYMDAYIASSEGVERQSAIKTGWFMFLKWFEDEVQDGVVLPDRLKKYRQMLMTEEVQNELKQQLEADGYSMESEQRRAQHTPIDQLFQTVKAYMDAWIPIQEQSGSSDIRQNLIRDAWQAFLEHANSNEASANVKALAPQLQDPDVVQNLKEKLKVVGYDVEAISTGLEAEDINRSTSGGQRMLVGPEGTEIVDEEAEEKYGKEGFGEEFKGENEISEVNTTELEDMWKQSDKYDQFEDLDLQDFKEVPLKDLAAILRDAPKIDDKFGYEKKKFNIEHVDYSTKTGLVRRIADKNEDEVV